MGSGSEVVGKDEKKKYFIIWLIWFNGWNMCNGKNNEKKIKGM